MLGELAATVPDKSTRGSYSYSIELAILYSEQTFRPGFPRSLEISTCMQLSAHIISSSPRLKISNSLYYAMKKTRRDGKEEDSFKAARVPLSTLTRILGWAFCP